MLLNFLPPEPISDNSNRWRSAVAVLVIVIGLGVFLLAQFNPLNSQFSVISQNFKSISSLAVKDVKNEIGGDKEFQPPQEVQKPKLPQLQGVMLVCDNFSAKSIIVKDKDTGAVLLKKNEYNKRPIASITKLMSALVILEKNLDWTTSTKVVGDEVADTIMYAGDTYTLEELWEAALVGSSNKAILTLADATGMLRQDFVNRMNEKAREMGMSDTSFTDPTGLDETDISTASDLSILISEALKHEKIKEAVNIKEIDLYSKERKHKQHIWNTDWLLLNWIPNKFTNLIGGKTGYIPASGYNFVMQVANDKGNVINVVVLGTESHEARFTECRDVADWVFKNYVWPENS